MKIIKTISSNEINKYKGDYDIYTCVNYGKWRKMTYVMIEIFANSSHYDSHRIFGIAEKKHTFVNYLN